jgi:hypothetical protein
MDEQFSGGRMNGGKMNTKSVAARLIEHLSGEGTMNDGTTDALYREAKRIPAHVDTDLETVEAWAQRVANS